jgi:hypothetical protein
MYKTLTALLFLSIFSFSLFADDYPEPAFEPLGITAHAHNDYEHEHPLWDALHYGFSSIEADVHLVDRIFYVAHDVEDISPERTLRSLYLDPLLSLVKNNKGCVFPDGSGILLLVDMKTEGADCWPALKRLLLEYGEMLSVLRSGKVDEGPVTVIVSGNRDWEVMSAEEICPAFYDGRFENLPADPGSPLIPLISASWTDEFVWDGKGLVPESDQVKMKSVIEKAHGQGRRIRFWATDVPDAEGQEYIWDLLLAAGVDVINTDKLRELAEFIGRRR